MNLSAHPPFLGSADNGDRLVGADRLSPLNGTSPPTHPCNASGVSPTLSLARLRYRLNAFGDAIHSAVWEWPTFDPQNREQLGITPRQTTGRNT